VDKVFQIWTIETLREDLTSIDAEIANSVDLDIFGRSGCKGHDRHTGIFCQDHTEFFVVGTEIMSPLTDAVGFVDDNYASFPLRCRSLKADFIIPLLFNISGVT